MRAIRVMMIGTCYAGPIEDGERVLRPLRACRTRAISDVLSLISAGPAK